MSLKSVRPLMLCLMFLLPFGSATAGSAIVAFEPETVAVPASLASDRVDRAVLEGLVIRGWRLTEINRAQGFIDAELPIRAHVGRVRVHIGENTVHFTYRESKNIDHGWFTEKQSPSPSSDGGRYFSQRRETEDDVEAVHRNYLSWVNELARTIDGTLMLAEMEGV